MKKRVFLRRVDGSKKNNTNARICLPEKFNAPLIIGRKEARGGGNNDDDEKKKNKKKDSHVVATEKTEMMFVGLENEPLLEEEHVEVTKRCLRSDNGNESVAVQVKPIGKAPVYIQTDSKNLKQLKRNQPVFLLKGQTMFLRYSARTKGFAVAFVVEEEEEEGNEKPIEVLEIEDSDGGSAEKNAKEGDDDDEVAKGEEDEVEIVEKEDEEEKDEEEARKCVLLKKKKKKKISRTKESLVSSSSDDEFVGQGEKTFVVEDDDDDDDDDDDIDDKNDEGNGSHGNEGRPIPRKKIVLGSSSSSSSSGSGDSRSRRLSSSESQEDGVEVGDLLTSEEEEEEEEEEEPSARPSGPSLLNLIHKKLKKETFKARSVASKKAAKTVKKRRVRDANGDDNHDDESYDTAPEDGEGNDGNIEEGDIIAKIKRKKAMEKSNPNKKMKPVPSSPIVIGSSDDDDDADIDAYDFEERATMKNKKKRSTAEVVETEDLENEHQHGKRKKVSDTPPNEWKNVMTARKATTISSMPGAAGARNKRSEAELLEKSSRETEIIAERLEEQIQRQKREMELERQVREQQRLDELEEQRAREARIRRQQQQQQQEQQQQQQQQHPPYTGEYQDDMSVVTSYAQMLDASAKLKYFEANELREATRRYEEASRQYSKKTYQSAKGPAYITLQQMKTNLQTTSFKHAQLKMEYSESSRAHKLAIRRAAATAAAAAAAAATTQSTNHEQQTSARKRREAAAATAAEESQDEKQWIEEKSAWDACFVAENDVDESIDPHRDTISGWSIRELKQRGALIGADFSSAIEKSEYIDAIIRRITAVGGKTGWLRLKRQKDASIETKKRQREKLKAYQESTAIDIEAESTTRLLQHQAHRTVEQWSHRADLRLFLVRCGVAVEGGERGRSDKQTLQKAYKRAMLKFHPDRQRTKTERDRVLAAEVTKFITQAWAQLK